MSDLRLAWATNAATQHACRCWHYSRSMPTPPRVSFGVWEGDEFVGVVIFSRGNAPRIAQTFGLQQSEVVELSRVALREHEAPVSRVVAVALRLLKRHSPGLRLVVSFADPEQGHHGGIYQALGWTYLGTTTGQRVYVDETNGRRWHSRMVSVTGVRKVYGRDRAVLSTEETTLVRTRPKHKYARALDSELAPLLEALAQPYPVRAADLTGGTRRPAGGRRFDSDPAASPDALQR